MDLKRLDTPCVLVDMDIVEHNIRSMQEYCNAHQFQFRPHIKTHKIPEIARLQLSFGAVGITCQKLGEAEVMADAGITDILIYYNMIGVAKIKRLLALAKRVTLSVAVDSEAVLRPIADAFAGSDAKLGVMIDCDTGYHRTGVSTPSEALRLAQIIRQSPRLRFAGLGTFPYSEESSKWFREARRLFVEDGIEIPVISGGGSGSPAIAHKFGEVTELRAGTYVFFDWSCVQIGIAHLEQCAERIVTTVVNRPLEHIAIVDAGSKTLSSDSGYMKPGNGYGYVVEFPEARIVALSEEHGHIDFSDCPARPAIGDVLTLIPNHACGTLNMHDEVMAVRNGQLDRTFRVAARGRIR